MNTRQFPPPHYFYVGPTYKQTKRIAWLYVRTYGLMIPGAVCNQQDLTLTLPKGQVIRLLGAEDYDSLRGMYADGVVMDEAAMLPTEAWQEVLRPMLTDFRGYAVFMGTPKGSMNLLSERFEAAKITPHWYWCDYKASDTDVIPEDELQSMKDDMRPEIYAQELENSFHGALLGAYYAKEMNELVGDGRMCSIAYDKTRPVFAAVDIGYSDEMVYVIFQRDGTQIDIIDCQVFQKMSIPDQHSELKQLAYWPENLILPHDSEQHEIGTGKTRKQVWLSLGYTCKVVKRHDVHDGIEMVRDLLPRVRMDGDRCATLLQAMLQYHSEWDDTKRVFKTKPAHTWASHYADAVRYLAAGEKLAVVRRYAQIDYRELDRAAI